MRFGVASILASTILLAGGCSLARPTARATSISIERTSGDAAQVAIELELVNTGDDEIELVEYDYVVRLADGASYGGRWAALRALPPEQTVRASIPAVLPLASLRTGATGWEVRGVLRYRDPQSVSRILYEIGLLDAKVSFEGSGGSVTAESATRKSAQTSTQTSTQAPIQAPGSAG